MVIPPDDLYRIARLIPVRDGAGDSDGRAERLTLGVTRILTHDESGCAIEDGGFDEDMRARRKEPREPFSFQTDDWVFILFAGGRVKVQASLHFDAAGRRIQIVPPVEQDGY